MFGLRLMFGLFWFCLGFFVFFGLDLEKTKKLNVFLFFFDKMMVKELWKTKKLKVFFGFLGVCGFSFFLAAQWKTKKKTLSFFGFSHFFNHHFIKKQKNLEFF